MKKVSLEEAGLTPDDQTFIFSHFGRLPFETLYHICHILNPLDMRIRGNMQYIPYPLQKLSYSRFYDPSERRFFNISERESPNYIVKKIWHKITLYAIDIPDIGCVALVV